MTKQQKQPWEWEDLGCLPSLLFIIAVGYIGNMLSIKVFGVPTEVLYETIGCGSFDRSFYSPFKPDKPATRAWNRSQQEKRDANLAKWRKYIDNDLAMQMTGPTPALVKGQTVALIYYQPIFYGQQGGWLDFYRSIPNLFDYFPELLSADNASRRKTELAGIHPLISAIGRIVRDMAPLTDNYEVVITEQVVQLYEVCPDAHFGVSCYSIPPYGYDGYWPKQQTADGDIQQVYADKGRKFTMNYMLLRVLPNCPYGHVIKGIETNGDAVCVSE